MEKKECFQRGKIRQVGAAHCLFIVLCPHLPLRQLPIQKPNNTGVPLELPMSLGSGCTPLTPDPEKALQEPPGGKALCQPTAVSKEERLKWERPHLHIHCVRELKPFGQNSVEGQRYLTNIALIRS